MDPLTDGLQNPLSWANLGCNLLQLAFLPLSLNLIAAALVLLIKGFKPESLKYMGFALACLAIGLGLPSVISALTGALFNSGLLMSALGTACLGLGLLIAIGVFALPIVLAFSRKKPHARIIAALVFAGVIMPVCWMAAFCIASIPPHKAKVMEDAPAPQEASESTTET